MEHALFDCREDYDQALKGLANEPENIRYKHQAVLALARSGSLELAQREFTRYGLGDVHDDEDVLGLGARLLKDAFIQSDAPDRTKLAQDSADAYLKAFNRTGGYYSGVNAATMTLLADGGAEKVTHLAKLVLDRLPATEKLSKADLYFVEATRAEAFLLLSQLSLAANALQKAWRHDPMNYIAHASTLRQIKMICEKRSTGQGWLHAFLPPACMHYAGHTYSLPGDPLKKHLLSEEEEDLLKNEISNAIQKNDIAFGYGALSAGADILIAESLLEEGGELNVVLPVDVERFRKTSVAAFGERWNERFDHCLSKARSVTIVAPKSNWLDRPLNKYAARIAMGNAIMQANFLSSEKSQLLILSGATGESYSEDHLRDWNDAGYETSILTLPGKRAIDETAIASASGPEVKIAMQTSDGLQSENYKSVQDAAFAALALRNSIPQSISIGLHCGIDADDGSVENITNLLAKMGVPGSILVSDDFAALLTVAAEGVFALNFAGHLNAKALSTRAIYSLGKSHNVPSF